MRPKRSLFGEKEPVICLQCKWIEAGSFAVSKGGALEPLPPETGPASAGTGGSNPSCKNEALAVCSLRPVAITWEALRPMLPGEAGNSRSVWTERLCVGAFVSRSKIWCAVRSKHIGEALERETGWPPAPHPGAKISKANSVRKWLGPDSPETAMRDGCA